MHAMKIRNHYQFLIHAYIRVGPDKTQLILHCEHLLSSEKCRGFKASCCTRILFDTYVTQ